MATKTESVQPRRLVIHYDNGQSWKTKQLRSSNALTVKKPADLLYEEKEPTEISEGLFQRAEFSVDMKDVKSLDIFLPDGELVTRHFRKIT